MDIDEEYDLDQIVKRFSMLLNESFNIFREPPALSGPIPVSPRSPFSPLPQIAPFSPLTLSSTQLKPSQPLIEETILSPEYLVDAIDIFTASAGILKQEIDKNIMELVTKDNARRSLADSKSPRVIRAVTPEPTLDIHPDVSSPARSLGGQSTVSSTTRLQQLDTYLTDLQNEEVVRDDLLVRTIARIIDVINALSEEIKDKAPAAGASRFSVEYSAAETKALMDISTKLVAERNRRIVFLTVEAGLLGTASNIAIKDERRDLLLDVLGTFRNNDQLEKFNAFIKIANDQPFDMSGAGQRIENAPRIDLLRSPQAGRNVRDLGDITIEYTLTRFAVDACRDNDRSRFESAIALLKQFQEGRRPDKFSEAKKLGVDYSVAVDRLQALVIKKNVSLAPLRVEQVLLTSAIEFQADTQKSKVALSLVKDFREEKRPDIFSLFLEEAKHAGEDTKRLTSLIHNQIDKDIGLAGNQRASAAATNQTFIRTVVENVLITEAIDSYTRSGIELYNSAVNLMHEIRDGNRPLLLNDIDDAVKQGNALDKVGTIRSVITQQIQYENLPEVEVTCIEQASKKQPQKPLASKDDYPTNSTVIQGHDYSGQHITGRVVNIEKYQGASSKIVVEQTAPKSKNPIYHFINISKVRLGDDVELGGTYDFKLPKLLNLMSELEIEEHCDVRPSQAYLSMNKGKVSGVIAKTLENENGQGKTLWVELPNDARKIPVVKFAPHEHNITDAREKQKLDNYPIKPDTPSAGQGLGRSGRG